MKRQLSLIDLVRAIQERIEYGTDLKCFDVVPDNQPAPFVFVEIVSVQPADTKTMYVKDYEAHLHIIADGGSSVPVYKHIQAVQEAMTDDIELPPFVRLVLQTDAGVQTIQTEEETQEKHAVLDYVFKVAYGFKIKT